MGVELTDVKNMPKAKNLEKRNNNKSKPARHGKQGGLSKTAGRGINTPKWRKNDYEEQNNKIIDDDSDSENTAQSGSDLENSDDEQKFTAFDVVLPCNIAMW